MKYHSLRSITTVYDRGGVCEFKLSCQVRQGWLPVGIGILSEADISVRTMSVNPLPQTFIFFPISSPVPSLPHFLLNPSNSLSRHSTFLLHPPTFCLILNPIPHKSLSLLLTACPSFSPSAPPSTLPFLHTIFLA